MVRPAHRHTTAARPIHPQLHPPTSMCLAPSETHTGGIKLQPFKCTVRQGDELPRASHSSARHAKVTNSSEQALQVHGTPRGNILQFEGQETEPYRAGVNTRVHAFFVNREQRVQHRQEALFPRRICNQLEPSSDLQLARTLPHQTEVLQRRPNVVNAQWEINGKPVGNQ
jgi:hypothetical protein